ncbi:MAG: GLPGLI family protein [Ekhidna sp.]|nr:GLPGLI family protein [Ekhidna sp.]MBC6409759.1 GLPGLI family protein [Ekhidna sp.]
MFKFNFTSHLVLVIVCSLFISPKNAHSQRTVIQANYEIKLAEDDFFFDSQLITDGVSSIFRFKYNDKSAVWNRRQETNVAQGELEGVSQTVYTDSIGEVIYNKNLLDPTIKVRGFCKADEIFIYEDSVAFEWTIKKDEKIIGGVNCRKAVCKFRGRKYEVFYNPNIGSFAGPWKFSGLPGLIVEVRDKRETVIISLKSIEILEVSPEILYNFSASGDNTSYSEAKECMDKEWLKKVEKMRANAQLIQAEYPNLDIEFEASETRTVTELEFD